MFRSNNIPNAVSFFSKRVAALVGSVALVASGLVAGVASPANAVSAPVVKSFDYTTKIETPGSSVSIPSAVYQRIDFNAQFNYDDVTSLRGHVITVDSAETGFTEANRPMVYAYFSFEDASNITVGNGAQINRVFSGQPIGSMNSVTVPDAAVKMDIGWVTAANISDNYYGPIAAGTYSSTPKILDRGTVASPTSPTEIVYTSDDVSTAGLYYDNERSYANVEGIASSFNLPATGNILGASATAVGCIDWSKVSTSTVATANLEVNGQAPDYFNVSTSDSVRTYSGNPVGGSTLDFSTGSLATWRSESKPIYVFATAEESDPLIVGNGMALDASLDVLDANNVSILKDCTPPAPTGTGTLGAASMQGRLQFTPTSFVPPAGDWACNLYKKSDNTLVATGLGSGSMPCMIGSYGPGAPSIPTGVPLYVKPVLSIKILGQSLSAEGATASNEFTMTGDVGPSCPPYCGPPPASLLTTSQTGGGSASSVTIGAEKSFGTNVKADDTLITSPDGKGALLAASAGASPGTWTITNLGTAGPSSFVRTVSAGTLIDLGWYGAAQVGWSAVGMTYPIGDGDVTWKVFYGLKGTTPITTSTIPDAALVTFCRTNAGVSYNLPRLGRDMSDETILSAPTSTPLLYLNCYDMTSKKSIDFIVKPGATNVTRVMSMKSPVASESKPCTGVNVFVNPNASSSGQAAMVIMTTRSATTGMYPCGSSPTATNGSRRIATISGTGVAKVATADIPVARVPLASNGLVVGPGYAANTWTGIVYTANKPSATVNISSTGVVAAGKKITLDSNTVFPQIGRMEVIKTLNNGSVVVMRIGYGMSDQKFALGKISSTGAVTSGKIVKMTASSGYDLYAPKNINTPSISEKGILNVYVTTGYSPGTNKYKAFSWKDIVS